MQGILGIQFRYIVVALLASWICSSVGLARPSNDDDDVGFLSRKKYQFSSDLSPNNFLQNRASFTLKDERNPNKTFDLQMRFSTRASSLRDENVQSNLSASVIGIDFNWHVTSWLKAKFVGGYQFAAGNAANVFGTEGNPYSGEVFDEAAFIATWGRLEMSAGIVETQFNPISSTFDPGGYAGLRQSISLDSGAFKGSLNGYQVAAGGGGVANRALDEEKNPLLTIANVNVGIQLDKVSASLGLTRFDFFGLTSASAGASLFLGNSTIPMGNRFASYRYNYRGQELAADTKLSLRLDDKLGLSGNLTQNDEAPAKRNFGWLGRAFYQYNFGAYSIQPSLVRFRFEPDVIPGFASRGSLGFLNRDGYGAELRTAFKAYNLDAFVRYLDAKEVEPKAPQTDRIGLTVGLEVKYVFL